MKCNGRFLGSVYDRKLIREKVFRQTSTETNASKKIHIFKRTPKHLVSVDPPAPPSTSLPSLAYHPVPNVPLSTPNQPNPPSPKLTSPPNSQRIGGSNSAPSTVQTPEEKAAELAAYDQKLYKAQCDMNESMSQVLKHLGVPFFGTHAALILPDSKEKVMSQAGKDGGEDKEVDAQGDRPKWSPRVTAKELMELKRRMVEYLEDMYKA